MRTDAEMLADAIDARCPVCRAHEVTGDHVEVEGGQAWQPVSCDTCGATWREVYTLTSVEVD